MKKQIHYSDVGDDYNTKDPIKKLAQKAALQTAKNLQKLGLQEISETRGESAYVWSLSSKRRFPMLAFVIEGLGTKNLVADQMYKVTGKTYYDIAAHDTVASIINDLVSVGARPMVINALWSIGENKLLSDKKRLEDLISGWKKAADLSGVSWGGGETPTLKGILAPNSIDLAGSAIGLIESESRLLLDRKIQIGDRIVLIKSTGINANGISLVRAVAKKLTFAYATKLTSKKSFGESVLNKTNIYAKLVQKILDKKIELHYISNITGHGLRKVMRGRQDYTYILEKVFEPLEIFSFIQKQANLTDYEMYQTFNMGSDYAIFLPKNDVAEVLAVVRASGFIGLDAGYVEKGPRKVVIKPKNITFSASTLDIR